MKRTHGTKREWSLLGQRRHAWTGNSYQARRNRIVSVIWDMTVKGQGHAVTPGDGSLIITPRLHGGPVVLRPARATPCFTCADGIT